jgi:S-adenosyl methyltransferase
MVIPRWAPHDIPIDKPSAARMYDYYLGGSHNFEIDRKMAEQAIGLWPDLPLIMQANRAFLRRAVRYLISQGVDQFLDIGSGIPTVGNVHEVAQRANPSARVVYVDIDPIAVAHSTAILQGTSNVAAIHGDVRQPEAILNHAQVRELLDFDRPVAVMLLALLHFLTDDAEARASVRVLRHAVTQDSYLAISHASYEGMPEKSREHEQLYARTPNPLKTRSRADIERFFEGFELVDPGLVYLPLWRPEEDDDPFRGQPERSTSFAGVGRKTAGS